MQTSLTSECNSDLTSYWMPFSDNQYFKQNPKLFVRAQGVYYYDQNDRQIFDGTSGLWCCNLGHGRQDIAQSVYDQLSTLDYAPPFQIGNPLAFECAQRLQQKLPKPLENVFFTNSGSESVDTALKIAINYHQVNGQPTRTRLIGRELAYHGAGFGGISIGGLVNNRRGFGLGLPGVDHLSHTLNLDKNAFSKGQPLWGEHLADQLTQLIQLHGSESIAALMVEPVSGSVGVLPPPKGYLQKLRKICDDHKILLIFDEVITGFGRMGEAFAMDYFGVVPDIVTMAKGLTNGAVPMGAVAVRGDIYDSFMQARPEGIELFHGYTYSGNPTSCAAALACLNVYEQEGYWTKAQEHIELFEQALFAMPRVSSLMDIRSCGFMGALQFAPSQQGMGRRGRAVFEACYDQGVLVRFNGDTIIVAPPLSCERAHLDQMFNVLSDAIENISED